MAQDNSAFLKAVNHLQGATAKAREEKAGQEEEASPAPPPLPSEEDQAKDALADMLCEHGDWPETCVLCIPEEDEGPPPKPKLPKGRIIR